MSKLDWVSLPPDYDVGLDRGVYYPANASGQAWSGLTAVQESPFGADEKTRYVDGVKTRSRRRSEEFAGRIEAYTYPESFFEDVLTPRRPKPFGLSYRVETATSYKIHLVYNVLLATTSHVYDQEDDPSVFSWDFTTLPVPVPEAKPTSHLIIEAEKAYSSTLTQLEDVLYGSDEGGSRLPTPAELMDIFEANSILRVIEHSDGTATISGPDEAIQMLDATTYRINWPSVVYVSVDTYSISSL